MLLAFQSVIMLMVLTRVCDVATAGIFTFAYASVNLFLRIGNYGMRPFQVSDVIARYSFREYSASRLITCGLMLISFGVYLSVSGALLGYETEKILVLVIMVFYKLTDALEDVLHANYQQNNRLDVGARVLTLRLATSIAVFSALAILTSNLVFSLGAATAYTLLFFALESIYVKRRYSLPARSSSFSWAGTFDLLKSCFPLFFAAFLLMFITNAPKFAIDAILDDTAQAYFGYIAMPVFVVGLFSSFVYNPMIASLSRLWHEAKTRKFALHFLKLMFCVIGVTIACVLLAWLAGVPVLNLLYNTDVSFLLFELIILVASGGFLALIALCTIGITIIRFQRSLIWGSAFVGILALFLSPVFVENWGINGAAIISLILIAILALWFGVTFVIGVRKTDKSNSPSQNTLG